MIARIIKNIILFLVFMAVAGTFAYLTLTFIIKSEETVVVPNLIGKDIIYSLEILTDLGLSTKIKGFEYSHLVPKNHLIFQEPEPGSEIKKGRDVRIIISKGTKIVLMPDLKNLSIQQARIIIEENGLHVGKLSHTYIQNVKKGEIIAQSPLPSSMIQRNGFVDILVSNGKRPVFYKMPDLKGFSLEDSILLLEERGLILGEIKSVFHIDRVKNVVEGQNPLAGYPVTKGSSVDLTVNRMPAGKVKRLLKGGNRVNLFRYRVENGFLKRRIKVRINRSGISYDLFNDYMKPGEEIWLLIPNYNDATLFLYKDNKLAKTLIFD
ncbi:MAG TPA: PASTA domain-containing protein [Desulfobacteraceae bacterium]|nr:PASTA domain-containing protein [Desulfobacteraceae bacterium]